MHDSNAGAFSHRRETAEHGCAVEDAHVMRSETDVKCGGVDRMFVGSESPLVAEAPGGTFMLFMGRRSLHRVAPVGQTARSRQTLLFSYDQKPGMVFPEKIRNRMLKSSPEPFLGQ